ncbi:hypothetical protein G3567_12470 [Psychroflexus sp. YR1-1]|uniref:Uncharacterized protein n=1 Tax=Psychroflexus aurantiacus TaxID=2709310 RepID=A0A6B3RBQ6_9FLAO|nr:hypothetical protein [Psychroflexus aurantiacus]NEV94954.1 hypothetical protein [Psychroflexus aurantiacus]
MNELLLINKHVENVLEDQPSRQEVIDYLDNIKRLQVVNHNITFFIATRSEFDELRRLWRFIHTSKLEVDYYRVFIYEIPKVLYDWLRSYSFQEIIDQIVYYNAYLNLLALPVERFKDIHPVILELVSDKYENLLKVNLEKIENLKFYESLIKDVAVYSGIQKESLLKYIISFFKEYNTLPIPPLMVDRGKRINDVNWEQIIDGFDFKIKIYGSFKYYYSLTKSRLSITRSDYEYTTRHLDKWKFFFKNDYELLDSIYPEVKVVSVSAKKTKYSWTCEICGRPADFENMKQELHQSDQPLCIKCYYEEYFEI